MYFGSRNGDSGSSATRTSGLGENSSTCGDGTSLSRMDMSRRRRGIRCTWTSIAVPRASAAVSRTPQACASTGTGLVAAPRWPWAAKRAARSSAIVAAPSTFSFAARLTVW